MIHRRLPAFIAPRPPSVIHCDSEDEEDEVRTVSVARDEARKEKNMRELAAEAANNRAKVNC